MLIKLALFHLRKFNLESTILGVNKSFLCHSLIIILGEENFIYVHTVLIQHCHPLVCWLDVHPHSALDM